MLCLCRSIVVAFIIHMHYLLVVYCFFVTLTFSFKFQLQLSLINRFEFQIKIKNYNFIEYLNWISISIIIVYANAKKHCDSIHLINFSKESRDKALRLTIQSLRVLQIRHEDRIFGVHFQKAKANPSLERRPVELQCHSSNQALCLSASNNIWIYSTIY